VCGGGFFILSHCFELTTLSYREHSIHAPRIDQTIIVVHNYFCGNIVFRDSNVQYLFRQSRTPQLVGLVVIFLGMLMYKHQLVLNMLSF
jgi:hypothetical protein